MYLPFQNSTGERQHFEKIFHHYPQYLFFKVVALNTCISGLSENAEEALFFWTVLILGAATLGLAFFIRKALFIKIYILIIQMLHLF